MDQEINQVLHNRYQLQSSLGHQTGRKTFLARDLETGLSVVIKLLLFGSGFAWQDLKLFEREAEVLKSLDHLAIPKYLDHFDIETKQGKGFALVQTYIEAQSLQAWIQAGRTFSEVEVKAIAKQLLEILDYLHNRQPPVIHRDIKPSNILLGDRSGHSPGKVYLIDFGSVQTTVSYGTRTIVGTYGYMPFEQFSGQTTPASDLYALGATLIYLATGQHPDQLPQRKMQIVFEDKANLSPSLVAWLQSMTEPNLEQRLKSAKQALGALETPTFQKSSLPASIKKPAGSRVRVVKTRQMLEILIPPPRVSWSLLLQVGWSIPVSIFLAFVVFGTLANIFIEANLGGLLPSLLIIIFLVPIVAGVYDILFILSLQVRVLINQSEIIVFHELLRVRYTHFSTAREDIVKLELTCPYLDRDSEGGITSVPAQINIWAGTEKFSLVGRGNLTSPEIDWLAQELSNWLDIPVTQINVTESTKKSS